jgi:hypothetical protein
MSPFFKYRNKGAFYKINKYNREIKIECVNQQAI